MLRTLNLGILAHVDAGKTSLTERLLHTAGVIDEIGSVDDGSTRTDSLALERQRGITIKSAVVSFVVDGVTVNLIDTPGHPDFIAEVERVLSVLDGAVLVISAVEGVQPQTRVLMRALRRLRIPTLIFVNKIDRGGADCQRVLHGISERLIPACVAMGAVRGQGAREAGFMPYGSADADFDTALLDLLTQRNDALLAAYLDAGTAVPYARLRAELAAQTQGAQVCPVFFGSAITGAGVPELMAGVAELLPATAGDTDGPVSGTVFKVERGAAGEKRAYLRMFSGTLRTRDLVGFGTRGDEAKVTAVRVFDGAAAVDRPAVTAGQIGVVSGLAEIQIGDVIGEARPRQPRSHFAPPTLESVVAPVRTADKGTLRLALAQLAEQDPLINVRQDDIRQEIAVSLYGEVQKEVIQATLADEYGIEVAFRETTTVCIERPVGAGGAWETNRKGRTDTDPFLATVGLRVDPAPVGAGVAFRLEVELGSMPYAYFKAVEETVTETLRQGLYGWQVVDCVVTMTHSGYWPRQSKPHAVFDKSVSSTAGDFRNLTPLVLMSALRRAGTRVYEPMHRFSLEIPVDTSGTLLSTLARLGGVAHTSAVRRATCLLEGEIPAAQVHRLRQRLPALTRGEGVLESAFERYQPVRGANPTRPRWDHNPLNRKEYLLHVVRRV